METDKTLAELIKRTLDNYEEEYIPGAWENFVNKRKKRQKMVFWKLGTGIAASLMIGWFGFTLLFNQKGNHSVLVQNKSTEIKKYPDNPKKPNKEHPSAVFPSDTVIRRMNEPEERNANPVKNNSHNLFSNSLNSRLESIVTSKINEPVVPESEVLSHKANTNSGVTNIFTDSTQIALKMLPECEDTSGLLAEHKISDTVSMANSIIRSDSLFTDINNQVADLPTYRKIRFGFDVSPGINATSSGSSFNFSGGITTDLALSHVIQLSTGLQIEHQNVVDGGNNSTLQQTSLQTTADLTSLDLPLNITWKFFSNKTKSYYISGGISSLTYLSEKYSNKTYASELTKITVMSGGKETVTYKIVTKESTEQVTVSSFRTFDFAGRLNLIVGLEQNISSNLYLHIEPYLKLPLSGLASQNMKFITSGITCKISF